MILHMGYPGGKGRAFQRLINLMPPHDVFIETHLGGGAIMLRKRRAARNVGIDRDEAVIARWSALDEPGVELVHGDAAAHLRANPPGPEALVFADPPYWPETRRRERCYRHDYRVVDHLALLDVLTSLDCQVMITGYPNDVYDSILAGWHVIDYQNCTQVGLVTERAWTNYAPPTALHDYDHLGMDFREREALRRRRRSHIERLRRATPLERNAMLADLADAFPDEMRLAVGRCE